MSFIGKTAFRVAAGTLFLLGAHVAGAEEHYVSQHRAKVVPNKIYAFAMPEAGTLDGVLPGEAPRAKRGELVGRVNRERLDAEALSVELRIESEKLAKKKEILALVRQKEELEYLRRLSAEERAFVRRNDVQADARAVEMLAEQIALEERRLDANAKQTREEFARKRELYDLAMPFDGRVQYHFPAPASPGEAVRLPAGAPIATVADDSAYFVAVTLSRPELARLPAESLRVRLELGGNETALAAFSHKRVEKHGTAEALVYYFRLPDSMRERAAGLLGANCVARLYFESAEPLKILSKAALARAETETPFASWEALVEAKFPDFKIVFVGETTIALREKSVPEADPTR